MDDFLSRSTEINNEIINVEGLLQSSIQEQRPKARLDIAWLQSDARQSAGKGCLSGICRGRETHSYNDRSCRGGNTSTALLCRYGMTLDLLFESVNGNIII